MGLIHCQIVEQASSLWTGRMPYILYLIATSYLQRHKVIEVFIEVKYAQDLIW